MKKLLAITLFAVMSTNISLAQNSTEPTLSETLNWIRNKALSYSSEKYLQLAFYSSIGKPTDIASNESQCSMTFFYPEKVSDGHDNWVTYQYTIYFSALNGNTITWSQDYANLYINISAKSGGTASWYGYKNSSGTKNATLQLPFNKSTFQGEPNLQERMTKAFKRAIVLCGGQFTEEKF